MNPHAAYPVSQQSLLERLWKNRQLIFQLTKRDVVAGYKGSLRGQAWPFLNTLLRSNHLHVQDFHNYSVSPFDWFLFVAQGAYDISTGTNLSKVHA